MSASKKRLAYLHQLLTEDMIRRLEEGEDEVVDGAVVKVQAKAATLGHITRFLKDNNIEALAEHDDRFKALASRVSEIVSKGQQLQ